MIIVAGGDSFVRGHELTDWDPSLPHWLSGPRWSNLTFPALLAKTVDAEYTCVAEGGYSNAAISRTVINKCASIDQSKFVIVSWTFLERCEFRFSYNTGNKESPWYNLGSWDLLDIKEIKSKLRAENAETVKHFTESVELAKRTGIKDFAETFYKHVHNDNLWKSYYTIKEIVFLQNYLKVNKIPYMFTCADNSIVWNTEAFLTELSLKTLYDQIDWTKWAWFPAGTEPGDTLSPRGFYQWALENKYKTGVTHPLDEAHADAAKELQGKFNELVNEYL